MNRRLILILTIITITATAFVIFYYFFKNRPTVATPTSNEPSLLPSGLPGGDFVNNNTEAIIGGSSKSGTDTSTLNRLRHLTLVPTAGDVIISKKIEVIENRVKTEQFAHIIRFADRATGHISETKSDSSDVTPISNTTNPKVYEAFFSPDGNNLIARTVSNDNPDKIISYNIKIKDKSATSKSSTTDSTITYLPTDLNQVAISPSGSKLLSLSENDGVGTFVVSDLVGKGAKVILTHPLKEWLISYPTENTAVISTKPSGVANGFAYTLNLTTGEIRKIIGGIAGLTILPNKNLKDFIGGANPANTIKLFSYKLGDTDPRVLPISTLPEKCVWSNTDTSIIYCAVPLIIPNATYPDDWYKGRVTFNDQLWKINIASGETTLVSNLSIESGQAIDAMNIMLSSDDKYLTFINKIDLTLWGLDLSVKK